MKSITENNEKHLRTPNSMLKSIINTAFKIFLSKLLPNLIPNHVFQRERWGSDIPLKKKYFSRKLDEYQKPPEFNY